MEDYFKTVKNFLLELNLDIVFENRKEGILMIRDHRSGIKNLIIGVSYPILVMEHFLIEISDGDFQAHKALLQKNREIVHGAFALDDSGSKLIFRDTLQIDHLDRNELQGSINSLALLMTEFLEQLLKLKKI